MSAGPKKYKGEIVPITDIYAGIYVKNVPKTAALLREALGAKSRTLQPDMVELTVGHGRLLLNDVHMKDFESEQNDSPEENATEELELAIWVDNIESVHGRITKLTNDPHYSDFSYISKIESQSGIKNFRFRLADGYYVRVAGDA